MMQEGKLCNYRLGNSIAHVMLITTVLSLLTACGARFWERSAPERPFKPEDLLVGHEVLPSTWESSGLVFPAGDDLATQESMSQGWGKTISGERIGLALQTVYRYVNRDVARRTFEHVYMTDYKRGLTVSDWTYQSPIADQSHFWCTESTDGSGILACEWGASYEEYIVTLQMGLVPGEVSLTDMEEVINAMDERIARHLDLNIESGR